MFVFVTFCLLQTAKARAEARLEVLRSAGINVDEWLAENVQNDDSAEADDSTTDGRLSPAVSAQSDLSDRVSVYALLRYKIVMGVQFLICFMHCLYFLVFAVQIDIFVYDDIINIYKVHFRPLIFCSDHIDLIFGAVMYRFCLEFDINFFPVMD